MRQQCVSVCRYKDGEEACGFSIRRMNAKTLTTIDNDWPTYHCGTSSGLTSRVLSTSERAASQGPPVGAGSQEVTGYVSKVQMHAQMPGTIVPEGESDEHSPNPQELAAAGD